ncbi:MAG: hypothetical protein AUH05_14620 [Ktedonobacter sp. 13_2_20CM_53_11]|nr:MAG: hypothetical protein AUH05_14620 [Ktedonobacter sp. 13_2_20CM_53_11]
MRVNREAQQAMGQWLSQATPPEQQLDRRWIGRYRELTSQDSYWWLSWAGPFTEEEQQQWDRLFTPPVGEATKELVAPLLKQSRERELEAALAEQREPRLWYPAIEINEVRRRITALVGLAAEIEREEPNEIVRLLYHGAIENDVDYLRMIEATHEGDTERYWALNLRIFHEPTPDEMTHAFTWLRRMLQQGIEQPETAEISQRLIRFLHEQLRLSLDLSAGKDDPPLVRARNPAETPRTISADAARNFYETILRESGYEGWQVTIDYAGGGTRVESSLRHLFLSQEQFTLERVRILLAHELAGHVARSFAGEHSPIGLLGIGTRDYYPTEEGLALYHERRVDELHGQVLRPFHRCTHSSKCSSSFTGFYGGPGKMCKPPRSAYTGSYSRAACALIEACPTLGGQASAISRMSRICAACCSLTVWPPKMKRCWIAWRSARLPADSCRYCTH